MSGNWKEPRQLRNHPTLRGQSSKPESGGAKLVQGTISSLGGANTQRKCENREKYWSRESWIQVPL